MNQLSYSIEDAQSAIGIGKTKLYQLIANGDIKAKKIGKRTVILRDDLDSFLSNLSSYPQKRGAA